MDTSNTSFMRWVAERVRVWRMTAGGGGGSTTAPEWVDGAPVLVVMLVVVLRGPAVPTGSDVGTSGAGGLSTGAMPSTPGPWALSTPSTCMGDTLTGATTAKSDDDVAVDSCPTDAPDSRSGDAMGPMGSVASMPLSPDSVRAGSGASVGERLGRGGGGGGGENDGPALPGARNSAVAEDLAGNTPLTYGRLGEPLGLAGPGLPASPWNTPKPRTIERSLGTCSSSARSGSWKSKSTPPDCVRRGALKLDRCNDEGSGVRG